MSKCQFAKKEVHYLGHVIGAGAVNPDPAKIKCIQEHPRPQTKRNVKAFLSLAGYYRRFVPGYAMMAAPPSDLTLQTDASGRGLGVVLSQVRADGEEHPIAYASRTLLPREESYAVIEKECLAIV